MLSWLCLNKLHRPVLEGSNLHPVLARRLFIASSRFWVIVFTHALWSLAFPLHPRAVDFISCENVSESRDLIFCALFCCGKWTNTCLANVCLNFQIPEKMENLVSLFHNAILMKHTHIPLRSSYASLSGEKLFYTPVCLTKLPIVP